MDSIPSYIALVASTIMPFLMCHFMYNAALRLSSKTILLTIGIFIALQGGIYAINFMRVLRLVLLENYRGGGPYLFLMFLPFVMLFTKKAIKITFVILIMLCIVSSMKRGAILAGLLSIIVYYFVSTLQSKNSNPIFKIIGISAVVLFVIIFFLAFDAFTGGTIIERFANISEDGGSNRDLVYEIVILMILESDFTEILFGHGWNTVIYYSPLGLSAHNDYLEILFDCGIFAFFLFCTFIVLLFHTAKKLIQQKSHLAPAFAANIVIIIINTMVSHIYLYTWYISALALFWGYCIGIERKASIDTERQ
ncbi:MAG: O-antigen ligase family protein [Prevotella sp.]|nr:O-antigen ligase family protein [Prevotella sp.]